jgi:hypothetical protein
MGLSVDKLGNFLTNLLQKGDPSAAMAAGKGPVTAEWAKAHGYTSSSVALSLKGVSETTPAGISLYSVYAKQQQEKGRIKAVKKTAKKKQIEEEDRRKKKRLLRRPSRERGIL